MFQHLYCSPAIRFYESLQHGKILIRGDSEGAINIWKIPDLSPAQLVIKDNYNPKKQNGMCRYLYKKIFLKPIIFYMLVLILI